MSGFIIKRSLGWTLLVFPLFVAVIASQDLGLCGSAVGAAGRKPLPTYTPNLNIMKIAHRGVRALAPENTIPALRKAIEMGYDYVELDVRYTRDGVPVIFHDLRLSHKTTGFGVVRLYRLSSLKKLDAGAWFGDEFKGTRIPTLEEYLKFMRGKINLYMDQKESPRPILYRLLKKYGYGRDNMVTVGFFKGYLRRFAEHYPDAPVMPWLSKASEVDKVLRKFPPAKAFNTSCKQLTPDMVREAHRLGVMVFTNVLRIPRSKERAYMRRTIDLGADAIQFDSPDVFFPLLKEMRKETSGALHSRGGPPK